MGSGNTKNKDNNKIDINYEIQNYNKYKNDWRTIRKYFLLKAMYENKINLFATINCKRLVYK